MAGLHDVLGDAAEADRWDVRAEEINAQLGFPYFDAQTKLARGSALGDLAMVADAADMALAHGFVGPSEQCAAALARR